MEGTGLARRVEGEAGGSEADAAARSARPLTPARSPAGRGSKAQPLAAAEPSAMARLMRAVISSSSPTPSTTCSLPRLA